MAYRQIATIAYGTRANTTINKPTGTLQDDVMVAGLNASVATVTPPAGWTTVTGSPQKFTGENGWLHAFYKVAGGSEGASYVFTHASTDTEGAIISLSGRDTAVLFDPAAANPVFTDIPNMFGGLSLTGLTTALTDTDIVICIASWDGHDSDAATATGVTFTERYDGTAFVADSGSKAAAGATGAIAVGGSYAFGPGAAVVFGVRAGGAPPAGPSYNLRRIAAGRSRLRGRVR